MTCEQILSELKSMGTEQTKRIFSNHGAPGNQYGVKVEDLKKIQKKIKKDYALSLELYDSGISDAQYLAGLIADETRMSRTDLRRWAEGATWYMISEFTVPWITAESAHGWELGLEWIDAPEEKLQGIGWATLASLLSITPDEKLDKAKLKTLILRVEKDMKKGSNRLPYAMNTFLIAVGGYVPDLRKEALRAASAIGKITVDMGNTACKVPYAPDYINKMVERGVKKRKMARC